MIGKTNQFFTSNDKVNYLCLAKELTVFWPEIPNEKQTEMMMKALTEWMSEHSESPMALLVLNTAMGSLAAYNIPLGLKLLDSCVQIYFQRRLSYEWTEVSQWIEVPERCKEWLYTTPRSDSVVQPCFFVLNAHLMKEMSQLRSATEEYKLIKRLADYIQSIKPKYIISEPAFLLCVEKWLRMLIRQFSNGVSTSVANEEIDVLCRWLQRVHTEEKSVSFFSAIAKFGRKPAFPIK
uniref:Uncharacterized protein n=1 Tax=Ditylenchus dipsaci TaxID=166011 RepID=A0A915D199_9BILA